VANLCAKFKVSSFNRSRDMEGVPKIVKSRSRDPLSTPFEIILHYFAYVAQRPICMPNLKCLASTVPEIWRGLQNSKSRSRDPFKTPFDPIFHFY